MYSDSITAYRAFTLTVINNNNGGVRFLQGNEVYLTSTGLSTINSGKTQTYFIPFQRLPDGTFNSSVFFEQLKIGSTLNPKTIPRQQFENNKKYTIEVRGSDASNLTLEPVSAGVVVDIDKLFGL